MESLFVVLRYKFPQKGNMAMKSLLSRGNGMCTAERKMLSIKK
jgi:hypothetical protein